MQFVLGIVGCLGFQGGPLWWAGKHRRHHKFCDREGDPHSASRDGTFYAWIWWFSSPKEFATDFEYVPPQMQTPELCLLDKFWYVPSMVVFAAVSHTWSWHSAVFYVSTPMIINRLVTTWFNVSFHPESVTDDFNGTKGNLLSLSCWLREFIIGWGYIGATIGSYLPMFGGWRAGIVGLLITSALGICNDRREMNTQATTPSRMRQTKRPCLAVDIAQLPASLVGEGCHADHHEHPNRMCRPTEVVFDTPYYFFILPLLKVGLVWPHPSTTKATAETEKLVRDAMIW
jgi:hypothetical protein